MKPEQEWSEAERFVWEKTRAGEEADFNSRENKGIDPKSPDGWDGRRISSEFLETILFEKPFREEVTRKGVRIIGACFPEKIDLEDGYLPWPLWLEHSRFENGLNMRGLQAEKWVSLEGSVVKGQLNLASASIGGNLVMEAGATFEEVDLRGAQIEGHLVMKSATVTGDLDLDSASIRGALLMAEGATFKKVILRGTQIKSQLAMIGARVTDTLNMDSVSIGDALLMAGAIFKKEVILRGAQIKGQLVMKCTRVKGTLNMDSVSIGDALLMDGATFTDVNLGFATVGSILNLTGGTFKTLNLTGATVKGELRLIADNKSVNWLPDGKDHPNEVQLNLQNTQVGTLVDSPKSWPDKIDLRGFTYRQLGGTWQEDEPSERPAPDFIKWLGRSKTFSFQPYQQLATVLGSAGKSSTADAVLFASKEREREKAKGWEKVWLSVLQYVIGYGIGLKTFRVLYWVIFFVLFGWGVLYLTGEDRKHEWTVGRIGLGFSLDYLLPVVQLREDHYKVNLTSCFASVYFSYIHQIVGYILVFFVIAALTGITNPSNGRGPPG